MKSLSPSIQDLLKKWPHMQAVVQSAFSEEQTFPLQIENTHGCLFSYFVSELSTANHFQKLHQTQYTTNKRSTEEDKYKFYSSDLVIVTPTDKDAQGIEADLQTIFPEAETHLLCGLEVLPYRPVGKGSVVFGKRSGVLAKMLQKNTSVSFKAKPRIFIITQSVFMSPMVPPETIIQNCFTLNKGSTLDTVAVAEKLAQIGYTRVPRVTVRGEFSLRGEVMDIFLPCDENATRIIFDFDEIDQIKEFEPDTQVTVSSKDSVLIYPMREVIWTADTVALLQKKLDEYQANAVSISEEDVTSSALNATNEKVLEHVNLPFTERALENKERMIGELGAYGQTEGEEFFYNFLWDRQYTLKDYIDESSFVIFADYDKMQNAVLTITREYNGMYRKARQEYPVLPPSYSLLNFGELIKNFSRCILFRTLLSSNDLENLEDSIQNNTQKDNLTPSSTRKSLSSESGRSFFGNIKYLREEFTKLQEDGWKIYIFADNENQALRINEIVKEHTNPENKNFTPVQILPQPVSAGFSISELKLLVIQENEIFGRRKYVAKSVPKTKSKAIDTFVELNPGDYVVHVNWGIGLFHGIERVKAMGHERDYIKLEYADKDFAYVPIEQVNLVQRYIGNQGDKPRLDTLGSKSWENRKNKTKKAVEDLAEKLISLYSRRQASKGFAFPHETEWQAAFEAAFPYEDTADQITVTEDIKNDMERPVPMDRLVCGDVGYGKTEIAMRAAFKAVMGGKQVAFLAPTTILAEQHYENCIERFKNFPVKIAQLSRFVTPAEQKKILLALSMGEVDILVGTHRIIQKDVKFKNLGLMIIDEEQRFGVKDKEKLKEMKNNIDCLTMSATPIPRTLHMSLLKIRDMSLLTTPPHNRQPIETVVESYSDDKICQAIRREIERGGQVFYLHNRVETLTEVQHKIESICPEVLVDVAHGQMTVDQLDDIFHRFKMGGFHVLIATTIIENGIDIPNVNTIIIDRADMYGVSQLYQLRGRVGRSDRKAYAYLLYPENKALSEVAMKRLQVISDFTELGSGFKIAMKDMEIRGAGNLLGKDQSGEVYAVGFDLYMRLLNEAVNRLTAQKEFDDMQNEVLMELEYSGFIPDTYVTNPQVKMEIYKKIASITTNAEFDSVLAELDDRFGPIPDEVSSLLALAEIRILCKKLKIASIKERGGEVAVEFGRVSDISVEKILKLIRENPKDIRLNSQMPNYLYIKLGSIGLREKSEFIREKLSKLG